MSRGPGRIERAVRALFDAHPDLAFVTDELVEHCYPDAQPVERKHQVAVLRAAWNVIEHDPAWSTFRIDGMGRGWVFFNRADAQSGALSRVIAKGYYRAEKRAARAIPGWMRRGPGYGRSVAELAAAELRLYMPNRATLLARLPDEIARDAAVKAYERRRLTKMTPADDDKRFPAAQLNGKETHIPPDLLAIAGRLRSLITENDPDAIRAGLAEIADALDSLSTGDP